MTFTSVLGIVLYAATVIGVALGFLHRRNSRRPTRHPLGQDVTLQRQPGEHLRQELEKVYGDELLRWIFALVLSPSFRIGRFRAELTPEQPDLAARYLRQLSGGLDYEGM